jgi:saccharopine dehydrogenase-like NADP-dependent oxidoreductase
VEKKFSYTLFAGYDPESRMSSMSRTTGYTCTGVAHCVLDGTYQAAGISAPSTIGAAPGCLDRIIAHLRERGIVFEREDER